ncbi:hypothetical protein ACFY40_06945 [Streptomyces sp. NPDC012950]|uniref:hypothetical protein n=1 Tax=Streptomyces sp. NPDC012950 TaxID=3364858 RepID=UPI0036B71798
MRRIPSPPLWGVAWFVAAAVWWIAGRFMEEPFSLARCVFYGGVPVAVMGLRGYVRP